MQFDSRLPLSPHFVTNQDSQTVELENCLILIYEEKTSAAKNLVPLLEAISKANKPLLIIAEDVDGEALATLVVNKMRGILNVCAVKAPGYGDRRKAMLGDLAVLTGGTAIFKDLGIALDVVKLSDLGRAKKLIITSEETTVVSGGMGKKEAIDGRADQIRRRRSNPIDSEYDREKLQKERLAKLAGGVKAQTNCGATTETEMKERKALLEDAKSATQAALKEGIVSGGGVALIRTVKALDKLELTGDEAMGATIIRNVLDYPLRCIAENAGVDGAGGGESGPADEGQERRLRRGQGRLLRPGGRWNYRSGPGQVRIALQNAASVASLLLDNLVARHRNPRRKRKRVATMLTTTEWAEAWVAWEEWAAAWVACRAWAAWE